MEEKQRKFLTRTLSTLWMIAGFTFVLYMGHVYISGMILLIQVYMARELFNLARKNKQSSGSQWLDWFLLPASLIIINDTAAYIFGVLMGRTPLIQLSPKKTLEGFIGALIFTIPSALLLAYWMRLSPWLTCPREDLSFGPLTCVPSPFFRSGSWPLHVLVYGLFASVIAPFGGFFASGLKRAFKIKDFGDSIPGHGGITDRMDCQMVMAVFSYIYYQSIISPLNESPANILDQALKTLTFEKQVELYKALGDMLYGRSHLCNATNLMSINI